MDPAGSLELPKWPQKLVREASVEIEPIWISLGLAKIGKKMEESGNHLDAGFSQVDAQTICVSCVVLHLRTIFYEDLGQYIF